MADDQRSTQRPPLRTSNRADRPETSSAPRQDQASASIASPLANAGSGPPEPSRIHRPFLERPLAIVTLIGGVLGIVTGLLAILGLPGSGDDGGTPSRIADCVAKHGLPASVAKSEVASGRIVFRECTWPPPPGATSDGFTAITLASREGPGRSEAEGLTVADVFTTGCRDIEVRYLFDNMGTFVPEQPVRVTKGEIRRVEGGSIWFPRNAREAAVYSPRRDEFVVLSAARYKIDSARCVS